MDMNSFPFLNLFKRGSRCSIAPTHSLRWIRATSIRATGVPLSHIKERGQWASDSVFKYIMPTVGHKLKWDKHYVR